MTMKAKELKKSTLFDPDFLQHFADFGEKKFPYSIALQAFGDLNSQAVPEDEVSIFLHVVEHEICAYEQRGFIYGPLSFVDAQRRGKRLLRCMDKPFSI